MLQTFIKRINTGLAAFALTLSSGMGALGLVLSPAVARAVDTPNWTINAGAQINFSCLGNGSIYTHTLLTANQLEDGTFTGTGQYDADTAYTWTVTGAVVGDEVNMVVTYTGLASGSVYNLTAGAIAADGSVAGIADGNCQSFTMSAGSFSPTVEVVESEVDVYGNTAAAENELGWMFNRDPRTATKYIFNSVTASLGNGSIYAGPITNTNFNSVPSNNPDWDKFIAEYFYLDTVESFDALSYDFKIAGNGTAADANDFYLNVYTNLPSSPVTGFYDCRFDFVPTTGSTSAFSTFAVDKDSVATRVVARNSAVCPTTLAGMPDGATIRVFAINVGDTSATDTGLAGHIDRAVISTTTEKTTYDFEPVSGQIIKPTDGVAVSGWLKLKATYNDGDMVNDDAVQWAVRKGTCAANTGTVLGNVDGKNDAFQWDGATFKARLDIRAMEAGEYCFVFNPTDDAGQVDVRETRNFMIEAFVPEQLKDCMWGGWKQYVNPSFRNQGQCIKYVIENMEKPRHHKKKLGYHWCLGWWRG